METVTEWHKHELLDRAHTLELMFNELLAEHPAAALLPAEIEQASEALHRLYQRAGEVSL